LGEGEITSGLRLSSRRVGRLYPVLLDKHGNIIDGKHRLAADPNWPKMRLDHIESEEDRLAARLISNVRRRNVAAAEKREILQELGEIYVKEGVKSGTVLARKIFEESGMSYRWVMKYLPEKFKDGTKSERRSGSVTCRVTGKDAKQHEETKEIAELTAPPEKQFLTVKKYANTHFVNVMVKKPFYTKLEKAAEELGTTPDMLINKLFS
jgi:hypothetical protein